MFDATETAYNYRFLEVNIDEKTRSQLQIIENSARRGADMVEQILTFGRGASGNRIAHQVTHLLRDVVKVAQQTFPKSIVIERYLPVATESETTNARSASQLLNGNGELILIVDDDPAVREVNRTLLEEHNYRTLTATDGIEAIAFYAEQIRSLAKPVRMTIDLVLIDAMMPNASGATAIRAIHQMNPQVKGGYLGAPDLEGIVEIGYSVLTEWQRQGYATEIVRSLVERAFQFDRVTKIIAHSKASIPASIAVLLKCGFQPSDTEQNENLRFENSNPPVVTKSRTGGALTAKTLAYLTATTEPNKRSPD